MKMRGHPLIIFCFFLVFINQSLSTQVPSIDEILKTNQYILVAQQDGVTTIETDVPVGKCPQFMAKPRTSSQRIHRHVGAHLVRDPTGRTPPMILLIKEDESTVYINIFAIHTTDKLQNSHTTLSFTDKEQGSRRTVMLKKTHPKLRKTLFDSTNRLLYFDYSTSETFRMDQFYIDGLFSGNFDLTSHTSYFRSSPSSRFDWEEDHYSGKFYYKERIDNEIVLFEIPMSALVPTAYEGEAGRKVGEISEEGSLFGATGGLFYTVNQKPGSLNWKFSTFISPHDLSSGITCTVNRKTSEIPRFNKLIVIRGNDYCMLKDGVNYNQQSCEQAQKEFLVSKGLIDESSDMIKWLLVSCIVMFMVIVLLFVYIYWLRSTFISDEDRSYPNEHETEASLFVSRQRSFPSVYQDPALLDVSVDKWN